MTELVQRYWLYQGDVLRRDLSNSLDHEAKRPRIPMTELASRFVDDGLNRLCFDQSTIAEELVGSRSV